MLTHKYPLINKYYCQGISLFLSRKGNIAFDSADPITDEQIKAYKLEKDAIKAELEMQVKDMELKYTPQEEAMHELTKHYGNSEMIILNLPESVYSKLIGYENFTVNQLKQVSNSNLQGMLTGNEIKQLAERIVAFDKLVDSQVRKACRYNG